MRVITLLGRRRVRGIGSVARLLVIIAAVMAAVACGSAATTLSKVGAAIPEGGVNEAPAASAGSAAGGDSAGSPNGAGGSGGNGAQVAVVDEAKIIRTGSVQVTVEDVAKAVATAHDAIRAMGGYVGASQQDGTKEKTVATITYRVPAARWDDALTAVRALGTVIGEKTNATEVTGQLVDLDARIRNLKASETALVGYAEKAPKVSDLLEIQSRLTDTRGQIEQLSAQQARLQDQVALATLTVTFGTEVVAVTQTAQRWDPGAEVDRATATLIGIGQAIVSAAIVLLIVWVPVALAVTAIAVVVLLVLRRLAWSRSTTLTPPAPPPSSAES